MIKKIAIIVMCAVLLLYLLMFLNTNQVVDDVKDVMLGKVEKSITDDLPIDRYNHSNIHLNAEVDVNITRLFVMHNFFDGYMWVRYSYETLKNDIDIHPASFDILSCWKIHRESGKWEIVDIEEGP